MMKACLFFEYITPIRRGNKVAVFVGRNVAVDAVRAAHRLGCLMYRRSRVEMPAREAEIHHAEEEEIEFHFLTSPARFIGDNDGNVCGVEAIRMELGEPDNNGRRRPAPIEGFEFVTEIDTAVVTIGAGLNPLLLTENS